MGMGFPNEGRVKTINLPDWTPWEPLQGKRDLNNDVIARMGTAVTLYLKIRYAVEEETVRPQVNLHANRERNRNARRRQKERRRRNNEQ